jgi:catechol 2,3-dioxygenase-like lactoylglutathione lyase family enzyme
MSRIAELVLADEPARWRALGFGVDDDGMAQVGTVRLRFVGDDDSEVIGGEVVGHDAVVGERVGGEPGAVGVRAWVLAALPDETCTDVDGLPTSSGDPSPPATAADHPLGVRAIDHVVVLTPDLDRTIAAIERHLGLPLRRVRESEVGGRPVRQAFFRLGEVVLEVVGGASGAGHSADEREPARFYGLAFTVDDLDAARARLGDELVSEPKPAVQRGRSIATVRRAAGLSVPVALMSPEPA